MSSPEALAAVTKALQNLLSGELGGTSVTTKPPSAARNGETGDQLNIFLYSVRHSSAFRNEPLPGKAKSGELAFPPLPLILKYLLTAYGKGDDDIYGQALLGKVMSILHDHPLLNRSELDSGLDTQTERIRITPDPLSLDDMSKLWSSFQSAEYRLSVGYEISLVLIDSTRSGKAPLPVLKRGEEDSGANVLSSLLPSLSSLRFPNQKPSAELGNAVILMGEHFPTENIKIRFRHPLLVDPIDIAPASVQNENEMTVQLPDVLAAGGKWPVGFYTVCLMTEHSDSNALKPHQLESNQLPMPIAPQIISVQPQMASTGDIPLTINCAPQIRKEQNAVLLFGDQIISEMQPADPIDRTTLLFTVKNAAKKPVPPATEPYTVRIRVDGVDSIPVDFSGGAPKFDPKQQVTVS